MQHKMSDDDEKKKPFELVATSQLSENYEQRLRVFFFTGRVRHNEIDKIYLPWFQFFFYSVEDDF